MANKYFTYEEDSDYYNDVGDVAVGVEPAVYTVSEFNTYFTGEIDLQQGYNPSTVCKQIVGFETPNVSTGVHQLVKQGYMPTMKSCFASLTTPGTYSISRSNSGITIGSTTYGPSSFRNNFVPHEIFVIIVGGGGGGGGNGYTQVEKDVFNSVIGGAGGGGGVVGYRLRLSGGNYTPKSVVVGKGGSAGSNHASDSYGAGTAGSAGGASKIIVNVPVPASNAGDQTYAQANGGGGGKAGSGNEDGGTSYGSGGAGGTGSFTQSYYGSGTGCKRSGGKGNANSNMNQSDVSDLKFTITTGTGAPSSVVAASHYVGGSPYNVSNSYLAGGCSYGAGVHQRSATAGTQGGVGGGGGAGMSRSAGKNGAAYFYY
jgi:hypothetical protein